MTLPAAVVSGRGAARWAHGHPWIYRSDVKRAPDAPAGAVRVHDDRGRPLGVALWSPESEISLRLLDPRPDADAPDAGWWRTRIRRAVDRRAGLGSDANAYRLVHGEGDGSPSPTGTTAGWWSSS
jgi:23S rRNA (cytosine1962-C5)-methyltransferase